MVILLVHLEMLGEPVDPLREDGDLDFGRARVRPVDLVGRNRAGLSAWEINRLLS